MRIPNLVLALAAAATFVASCGSDGTSEQTATGDTTPSGPALVEGYAELAVDDTLTLYVPEGETAEVTPTDDGWDLAPDGARWDPPVLAMVALDWRDESLPLLVTTSADGEEVPAQVGMVVDGQVRVAVALTHFSGFEIRDTPLSVRAVDDIDEVVSRDDRLAELLDMIPSISPEAPTNPDAALLTFVRRIDVLPRAPLPGATAEVARVHSFAFDDLDAEQAGIWFGPVIGTRGDFELAAAVLSGGSVDRVGSPSHSTSRSALHKLPVRSLAGEDPTIIDMGDHLTFGSVDDCLQFVLDLAVFGPFDFDELEAAVFFASWTTPMEPVENAPAYGAGEFSVDWRADGTGRALLQTFSGRLEPTQVEIDHSEITEREATLCVPWDDGSIVFPNGSYLLDYLQFDFRADGPDGTLFQGRALADLAAMNDLLGS